MELVVAMRRVEAEVLNPPILPDLEWLVPPGVEVEGDGTAQEGRDARVSGVTAAPDGERLAAVEGMAMFGSR